MKITIDAQPLLGRKAGVGYYIWGLIHGLAAVDSLNQYQLSIFDFKRRASKIALPGANFKVKKSFIPGRLAGLIWKKKMWPTYDFFFGDSDVYHFPNFVIRPLKKGKKVVTIHDVSFLRYPQFTEPKNLEFLKSKINDTLRVADQIIVDSFFTKKELLSFFNIPDDRVHVIHLGLDRGFKPCSSIQKKPVILFVGTLEPRKNLETLFKSFESFLSRSSLDFNLQIAGMKGWLYEGIFKSLEGNRYRDRIQFLDYVSDEDLPRLYQSASLFVYPSFYEGFGLPPLEAMACGVPVIASRKGSLPEILGNAAKWIDPGSADELSYALEEVLTNKNLKESLIQNGFDQIRKFNWEQAAQKTLEVYHKAMG
jgi:glycosyltransferase involved in cell wall biosynthesis